jgi:type II secretory pathway pseudopilin PulG
MATRVRKEGGFGLVELIVAIAVLNIGILALMAAFGTDTIVLRHSSYTSNATALADKAMETYRDLYSSATYLTQASIATAPSNYAGLGPTTNEITDSTGSSTYAGIPASTATCLPKNADGTNAVTWFDPTKATQTITGPDGVPYTMYIYIGAVQPSGPGGTTLTTGYSKQVTIVVYNAASSLSKPVLARESSIFDPNATGSCP